MRKLPSIEKVNRLYWLEEWSQQRIAKKYNCSPSAVYQFMKRHKLKMRPRSKWKRNQIECAIPGCEEPTCRIKRWRRGEFHFEWTNRCAKHHHERVRRWVKCAVRKFRSRRGVEHRGRQRCTPEPTGKLSTIAKEDS